MLGIYFDFVLCKTVYCCDFASIWAFTMTLHNAATLHYAGHLQGLHYAWHLCDFALCKVFTET